MSRSTRIKGARLFAPEVVQTSVMDCGPAALACLLRGFGIPASYPRLQEACNTDVDGTSINTLEQIAGAAGLEVEQVMLPVDHLLLPSARALPALLVVRRDNLPHFLVAWRRHGPLVQIMDPAKGRRWLHADALRDEIYLHHQKVPAEAWREWAGSPDFLSALRQRLRAIGVGPETSDRLVAAAAIDDPGWRSLAVLDASIRMVSELVRAKGVRPGRDAAHVLSTIARRTAEGTNPAELIPAAYWSVLPDDASGQMLVLRGAVLLTAHGRRVSIVAEHEDLHAPDAAPPPTPLGRVFTDTTGGPVAEAWRLVRADGLIAPLTLAAAGVIATVGGLIEVVLLRGALELGSMLVLREQRLITCGLALAVIGMLLVLDIATTSGILRLGRRLETRLRAALLTKLPTLGDQYFRSRPIADLAHRAHSLDALRQLPELGSRFLRTAVQLLCTSLAIAWLDPASTWLALLSAVCALAIPLSAERLLAERELRQRSHAAALSRHYLDTLLGLTAARTHAAERPLRQRHEGLLLEWGRSSVQLLRGAVVIEGAQLLVGSLLAVWLVLAFVDRGYQPGSTLLFVYWALSLPMLGRDLANIIRQFPAYRNILARILEPLAAPASVPEVAAATATGAARAGVEIQFDQVAVRAGGHEILSDVSLSIDPGEHVAIVGRSGAGKSTLAGLLFGWHTPAAGTVRVDGESLGGEHLVDLRRHTAWVDPSVHLWNRSLFDNLRYGDPGRLMTSIGSVVETAELTDVLEKLPAGLQSPLGEAGGLTSGGEGQRVRFGRALLREPVRLAILDEPFRGLDRDTRHELLARARDVWRDATLMCVTHDISDTLSFERVIVLDAGRIVEDGNPSVLCNQPESRYGALLAAERAVSADLWNDGRWRRWRMHEGSITEDQITQVDTEWMPHQHLRGQ